MHDQTNFWKARRLLRPCPPAILLRGREESEAVVKYLEGGAQPNTVTIIKRPQKDP